MTDSPWQPRALEVRHRLLSLRDGALVELLAPGVVVGLTGAGRDRVALTVGAVRPGTLHSLEEAVEQAVVVLRDDLRVEPASVEVWRPCSPPPPPARGAPGAPTRQERLW